jgi:site-specific DNA recombinase
MLQDIESEKDNVDFVLVFKLSRFGRNAADVLSSLQRMQDFGVNLICVEDGIDSSKDAGRKQEKASGMVDLLHMVIS